MKFTCKTESLKKAVERVLPGLPAKTVTPILQNIKLEVETDTAKVITTNMTNYYEASFSISESEGGTVLIPGQLFSEIVKASSAQDIQMSKADKENTVKVTSGTAEFKLKTAPIDEFPTEPKPKNEKEYSFTIKGEELKEIVKKTAYATSKDGNRPLFQGIYFNITKDKIDAVGTNTHRISIVEINEPGDKETSANIPSSLLNNVARLVSPADKVTITTAGNMAVINTADWKIFTNCIEGKFPDYRRIIPTSSKTAMSVSKADLLESINRVNLCSSSDNGYSIIVFQVKDNELTIRSHGSQELGTAQETIPCEKEGEDIVIAFNAKYIVEYLKSTDAKKIRFMMKESLTPIAIEEEKPGYKYIVTPIRVTLKK